MAHPRRTSESAAQIPDSQEIALTLTRVSSQSKEAHWQRPDSSAVPTAERPTSERLVDPEDDLPSDTYAGDFETTLIPHYDSSDSGSVRSSSSGFGLLGKHEPLPYQPQSTGRHSVFAAEEVDEHGHHDD